MVVIRALDGSDVAVDENAITLVAGPYPHDVGPHTYIHGVERGVLVTAEDAAGLVARLRTDPPLAKLTRPNSTPVWIKRSGVSEIRAPLETERPDTGMVRAVVIVGDLHQGVREDIPTASRILSPPGPGV
jgi:hypothetical protein